MESNNQPAKNGGKVIRNKYVQMSLFYTCKGVATSMEEDKPKPFRLLDEHIDWDAIVPARFYIYMSFNQNTADKEVSVGGVSKKLGTAKDIWLCE